MTQTHSPPTHDAPTRPRGVGAAGNRLLAAMPDAEFRRWEPHLELVELSLGQVLFEPGRDLGFAWFPRPPSSRCST